MACMYHPYYEEIDGIFEQLNMMNDVYYSLMIDIGITVTK